MKTLGLILSVISAMLVTMAIFFWFAAGEIYDYQDSFRAESMRSPIDVVLCLAGGKRRIPIAIELWLKLKDFQKEKPPLLFLSGVGPQAKFSTLVEQGVSQEIVNKMKKNEVIFENVSENTHENAQLFASFARQNRWKNVIVVTAGYHMRRAEFILKKLLDPEVQIYTSTVDAVHFDRNEWHRDAYAIRVTLIEYIKWLYYRYSY